jgi:hypothetical protein
MSDPAASGTPKGLSPQPSPPATAGSPGAARTSFYSLEPGGWRDYVTLLHPPYTVWHLSYVAMGAAVATTFSGARLAATLLGFFLGVGLSAHAFDELAGRPLRTRIPDGVLRGIAWGSLAGAVALGVAGATTVSWWLLAFVAFGVAAVVAYNLELLGGRFHTDLWFAVTWGAFPALTGAFAQTGTLTVAAGGIALGCLLLSLAQRRLSTPVRSLRRHTVRVEGRIVMDDGREVAIDERSLRGPAESALRVMWIAVALLAAGMVAARVA